MPDTSSLRAAIRAATIEPETDAARRMIAQAHLNSAARERISARATDLIRTLRCDTTPGLMEQFLAEYGLSTNEGVALMCLAEALLRVPDAETIDALIQDKIVPADWGVHLGRSSSSLVNASTWALMLTGRVLSEDTGAGLTTALHAMVRRLGEPVVRRAVSQAMREMGQQFVLGETITGAMGRAAGQEERGFTYSYDMLGETARTDADAERYHLAYANAIGAIAGACKHDDIRLNPGISVKLSALHCRYEYSQRERTIPALLGRLSSLAGHAKSAHMGLNIDAEEADRLDLSLDIIEQALSDPALAGWDGFGVVVQAYGPRATFVIDWLHGLAGRLDRRIMLRLVKGAYWDTEIKRAQVLGLDGFPVFTRKATSDVSFIACARKLLAMTDRIYPQFATHNAHTVAAVLEMADDRTLFEFQRLHGMGEALHSHVLTAEGTRCRIYAPVGAHQDLLAYLVRRLLENGANSSFVNQIVDVAVPREKVAADPFATLGSFGRAIANPRIIPPTALFGDARRNAKGWDLTDPKTVEALEAARAPFKDRRWSGGPMLAGAETPDRPRRDARNPANPDEVVGSVLDASASDIDTAYEQSLTEFANWSAYPASARADCLRRASDLYESNAPELLALAAREAGKTLADGISEIREAVDFLRYYAAEAERLEAEEFALALRPFVCISPWNFPLAIFTGQVAAALAAGNTVLAKPAEQTCLIAASAVRLMHQAGIPERAIQLLPGDGPIVGGLLVGDARLAGVCFTGSTETARQINRSMAEHANPAAPLIAETGGLNAMIVDSTALPEQAVRDIITSAFQSAGQRCSATRIVYVQEDVEERTLSMLKGAMAALRIGDPWNISTDVGPIIDDNARADIQEYIRTCKNQGRVIAQMPEPKGAGGGRFVPPTIVRVGGIEDMEREIFGSVLHVATFDPADLDGVVEAINARGYGLTLGIHTRVDSRVQDIVSQARIGNFYVNRNQIGAVVGSQPFGGVGLSGTGPKAGGPLYLRRFQAPRAGAAAKPGLGNRDLPGPTGESNRYSVHARGRVVCMGRLGGEADDTCAKAQMNAATALGNSATVLTADKIDTLKSLTELARIRHEGPSGS